MLNSKYLIHLYDAMADSRQRAHDEQIQQLTAELEAAKAITAEMEQMFLERGVAQESIQNGVRPTLQLVGRAD